LLCRTNVSLMQRVKKIKQTEGDVWTQQKQEFRQREPANYIFLGKKKSNTVVITS